MTSGDPPFLVVGHVRTPHGVQGELAVSPLTDHPGSAFAPGVILPVGDADARAPDPAFPDFTVEASRPHGKGLLVRLEGVGDRSEAGLLSGRYLLRPTEEMEPLEEGELFYHQLLGMEVVTVEGDAVGEVAEVFEVDPAHLLEVRGGGRTRYIPFSRGVVTEVDVEAGRIVLDPPEGLLEL